jgi:selenocysteine lyase/cysteine desulfurase
MNVAKIRDDLFPVTKTTTFLDIANHSPPCVPVQEAIRGYLLDWDRLDRRGDAQTADAVALWAKLVGCSPDEACSQPNTSSGLAIVAEALRFKEGDNVVVNDLENPANLYPWMAQRPRGVEIRFIKGRGGAVRIEDLEKAVDDRTKVVSVSHVEWLTGVRHDIGAFAEVAHEHGAYLVVDGIQAAGALKVDVKRSNVDFYANGAYKWLVGCSGAGFLYIRKDLITELDPIQFGYRAVEEHDLDEPKLKANAKKYELGEPSYLSTVGTKAAIAMLLQLGPSQIEARVLKLSQRLYDGLEHLGVKIASPREKEMRSGVVSFTTKDTEAAFKYLKENGFHVSLRPAGIRVSTDFYNTEEEIDRLLSNLADQLGQQGL